MDILLLAILSYQLYRIAKRNGVAPMHHILNYIAAVVLTEFTIVYALVSYFKLDANATMDDMMKIGAIATSATVAFEVGLFMFLRNRIRKIGDHHTPEDSTPKDPQPPKKDFSYFR